MKINLIYISGVIHHESHSQCVEKYVGSTGEAIRWIKKMKRKYGEGVQLNYSIGDIVGEFKFVDNQWANHSHQMETYQCPH